MKSPPTATSVPAAPSVYFVSVAGAGLGGRASASVKAPPGAACTISYITPAGTVSSAQGLFNKNANGNGDVSWSWVIGTSTRPGTGVVAVNCAGITARASIAVG